MARQKIRGPEGIRAGGFTGGVFVTPEAAPDDRRLAQLADALGVASQAGYQLAQSQDRIAGVNAKIADDQNQEDAETSFAEFQARTVAMDDAELAAYVADPGFRAKLDNNKYLARAVAKYRGQRAADAIALEASSSVDPDDLDAFRQFFQSSADQEAMKDPYYASGFTASFTEHDSRALATSAARGRKQFELDQAHATQSAIGAALEEMTVEEIMAGGLSTIKEGLATQPTGAELNEIFLSKIDDLASVGDIDKVNAILDGDRGDAPTLRAALLASGHGDRIARAAATAETVKDRASTDLLNGDAVYLDRLADGARSQAAFNRSLQNERPDLWEAFQSNQPKLVQHYNAIDRRLEREADEAERAADRAARVEAQSRSIAARGMANNYTQDAATGALTHGTPIAGRRFDYTDKDGVLRSVNVSEGEVRNMANQAIRDQFPDGLLATDDDARNGFLSASENLFLADNQRVPAVIREEVSQLDAAITGRINIDSEALSAMTANILAMDPAMRSAALQNSGINSATLERFVDLQRLAPEADKVEMLQGLVRDQAAMENAGVQNPLGLVRSVTDSRNDEERLNRVINSDPRILSQVVAARGSRNTNDAVNEILNANLVEVHGRKDVLSLVNDEGVPVPQFAERGVMRDTMKRLDPEGVFSKNNGQLRDDVTITVGRGRKFYILTDGEGESMTVSYDEIEGIQRGISVLGKNYGLETEEPESGVDRVARRQDRRERESDALQGTRMPIGPSPF